MGSCRPGRWIAMSSECARLGFPASHRSLLLCPLRIAWEALSEAMEGVRDT
jgi:hypothetical protein